MPDPLIVEVSRSGFVESTHLVDLVVLDGAGGMVASAGDPDVPAAFRSSAKPIQAAASRALGWNPADERLLAIACASHIGEPVHVGMVRRLLASVGSTEAELGCPPAFPVHPADAAAAGSPRRVQHNCSGKHAGFLAACVASGLPTDGYLDHEGPLQRRMLQAIRDAADADPLAVLVDGCGAATPVLPLRTIARAFMQVDGSREADAMLAQPVLVSGQATLDTLLLEAGLVAKGGAEGLSCVVGRDGKGDLRVVASKVRDGSPRGRGAHLLPVLAQLGLLEEGRMTDPRSITLGGGQPVGEARLANRLEL